ncbi:hypothetical protein EV702DRAFT_931796, partial [Suillus placidus]
LKRSYHANLVEEVAAQLDRDEVDIIVDKRIGILRDRSLSWIWNAFQTINKPEIVKKAFEMCTIRGFNLLFECLVGFQARDRLRNLKNTDPKFWKELTGPSEQDIDVSTDT